jgi:hypothetical protein
MRRGFSASTMDGARKRPTIERLDPGDAFSKLHDLPSHLLIVAADRDRIVERELEVTPASGCNGIEGNAELRIPGKELPDGKSGRAFRRRCIGDVIFFLPSGSPGLPRFYLQGRGDPSGSDPLRIRNCQNDDIGSINGLLVHAPRELAGDLPVGKVPRTLGRTFTGFYRIPRADEHRMVLRKISLPFLLRSNRSGH